MKTFIPLEPIDDDEQYAKALECHVMGFSEYLAALLYGLSGQIPRDVTHIPVKLVEDLKIRVDATLGESLARMKRINQGLREWVEEHERNGGES